MAYPYHSIPCKSGQVKVCRWTAIKVSPNREKDRNQDSNQDNNQDTNQDTSQDSNQDTNQDSNQDTNQDTNQGGKCPNFGGGPHF